jgi:hypothetical protein
MASRETMDDWLLWDVPVGETSEWTGLQASHLEESERERERQTTKKGRRERERERVEEKEKNGSE